MAPKTLLETIRRKKSSEFVESAVVHQGPDIGGVVMETLFTLAGQTELARRARPSARRPGRLLDLPDEDEDTGTQETESA